MPEACCLSSACGEVVPAGEVFDRLVPAPEDDVGSVRDLADNGDGHLDALAGCVEVPVTVIGEVTDTAAGTVFRRGGEPVKGLSGWDHFS